MSSAGEEKIGEERCTRLERHRIQIAVDELRGVHVRIYEGNLLLSHLAATPSRARSIGTMLLNAADRVDPAGATLVLVDVSKFDEAQRLELRRLLQAPTE